MSNYIAHRLCNITSESFFVNKREHTSFKSAGFRLYIIDPFDK
jgi:hypothetical protein